MKSGMKWIFSSQINLSDRQRNCVRRGKKGCSGYEPFVCRHCSAFVLLHSELLGRQLNERYRWEAAWAIGSSGKTFHPSRKGRRLLKDLQDRREKTEAGNCAASGPVILSLPDMCASPIDTCREHEREAVPVPVLLFLLASVIFLPLCFIGDRCQMTRMNGERKGGWHITRQSSRLHLKYMFSLAPQQVQQ